MRLVDRLVVGGLALAYGVLRHSSEAIEGMALRRIDRTATRRGPRCGACDRRAIQLLKRIEERHGQRT